MTREGWHEWQTNGHHSSMDACRGVRVGVGGFQDNPIALIAMTLFTSIIISPTFIDLSPGSDSNDAYYSDQENGNLGFQASALIGGGKVHALSVHCTVEMLADQGGRGMEG